jgi:hypothetical protein
VTVPKGELRKYISSCQNPEFLYGCFNLAECIFNCEDPSHHKVFPQGNEESRRHGWPPGRTRVATVVGPDSERVEDDCCDGAGWEPGPRLFNLDFVGPSDGLGKMQVNSADVSKP